VKKGKNPSERRKGATQTERAAAKTKETIIRGKKKRGIRERERI